MLSRSHNVVEAFAKLLRKRQALMPKMVVAGHLAINVPSLSPLPSREERLYLPSITSSYRRRYVKVGRFGATGANNRRCSESEFSQDPKRTPNVLVEIDLPGHQYRRRQRHEGSGGSWHWKNSQMCSV